MVGDKGEALARPHRYGDTCRLARGQDVRLQTGSLNPTTFSLNSNPEPKTLNRVGMPAPSPAIGVERMLPVHVTGTLMWKPDLCTGHQQTKMTLISGCVDNLQQISVILTQTVHGARISGSVAQS